MKMKTLIKALLNNDCFGQTVKISGRQVFRITYSFSYMFLTDNFCFVTIVPEAKNT